MTVVERRSVESPIFRKKARWIKACDRPTTAAARQATSPGCRARRRKVGRGARSRINKRSATVAIAGSGHDARIKIDPSSIGCGIEDRTLGLVGRI